MSYPIYIVVNMLHGAVCETLTRPFLPNVQPRLPATRKAGLILSPGLGEADLCTLSVIRYMTKVIGLTQNYVIRTSCSGTWVVWPGTYKVENMVITMGT
jgi:hypothetical protein